MADERLAQTYAQALFEQAVATWLVPLKGIADSLARAGLTKKLDDTSIAFAQKQEMLKSVVPTSAAAPVQNLISLLVSKNQMHLLPEVVAYLERFAQRGATGDLAKITSAVALMDAEKQSLETKLRAQFGSDIAFEYVIDKDILGGLLVRVGDKVIDGSVAGKLAALKEKLK